MICVKPLKKSAILSKNFETGFSLVETLLVVFMSCFIMLAIGSQILQAYKNQISAQSQSQLIQEVMLLSRKIDNTKSAGSVACSDVIKINMAENSAFNPAGSTEVEITPDATQPTTIWKKDFVVNQANGLAPFRVNQLQLTDSVLIASNGPTSTYVSNLMIAGSTGSFGSMVQQRPRQIATLTVTVGSTGAITSCNINPQVSNAQAFCDGIEGMIWDPNTEKCHQNFEVDDVTLRFSCPPGFNGTPGSCKPIQSTCASGQIARGYHRAQVANCAISPAGPARGPTRAPVDLTLPEGASTLPVIPPAPTTPAYVAPVAVQSIAAPTAPAAPPAACVNGTNIGEQTAEICYPTFSLDPYSGYLSEYCVPDTTVPTPGPANANCVGTSTNAYTSPNLASVPPSPAPPADLSCQCNNRRIANGEVCMYCIQDVDLGYGYVDYAYGVSTCTNGNLVPVANPQVNVGPSYACGNTYGRARYSSGRYQMYNENLR